MKVNIVSILIIIIIYYIVMTKLTEYLVSTENENADKKSILKLLKMTIGQDVYNKSPMKNSSKGFDIKKGNDENCK